MGTFTEALDGSWLIRSSAPNESWPGKFDSSYVTNEGWRWNGLLRFANYPNVKWGYISKIVLRLFSDYCYVSPFIPSSYMRLYKVSRTVVSPSWNEYNSTSHLPWTAPGMLLSDSDHSDIDNSIDLVVPGSGLLPANGNDFWFEVELDVAKFRSLQASTKTVALFFSNATEEVQMANLLAYGGIDAYVRFYYNGSMSDQCDISVF